MICMIYKLQGKTQKSYLNTSFYKALQPARKMIYKPGAYS